MSPSERDSKFDSLRPLASYVLRVRGRPATLRFELHDVRSGEKHTFTRSESVVAFLLRHGDSDGDATEPSNTLR